MKILGFETASSRCSVAIAEGNDILAADLLTSPSMQAEELLGMIGATLAKAQLTLEDIEYLVVTNGPGSFTGIRIGLATALGLVMATQIRPIVVSNLETINFRIREQFRGFDYAATIIDAYRGECYFQVFDKQNQMIYEPLLLKLEDVRTELDKLKGVIVCGGSTCHKLMLDKARILPRFPNPDARILCRLAYTKILKNNYSSNIEPLYIRLPDAKLPNITT
jgi:tRNA threonylcarbamoyladenosine biosynthesis protein TsaB